MSTVKLLSREGEIAIAKRIKTGREAMITSGHSARDVNAKFFRSACSRRNLNIDSPLISHNWEDVSPHQREAVFMWQVTSGQFKKALTFK